MSLSFRDYVYNPGHPQMDAEPAIKDAMNQAAGFQPDTVVPQGSYQWSDSTGSLNCFVGSYSRRGAGVMTFAGWLEALSRMWLFNQNYKKLSFAVDISVKETDAEGRTQLYDSGDCYVVF